MLCPVIQLTQQLVRCRSVSPDDAGCQDLLITRLENIGFKIKKIHIFDTKNFWATHGEGKTLAFAGHTDVVTPGDNNCWLTNPFEPTIQNGLMFGRGTADMKGSLAAMIIAAERFISIHPNHKGRLAFLITSDEESCAINGTVKVVKYLIDNKEHLDYCIIGEPTSTEIIGDVIKNGRRGSLTANLTVYGIQGHIAYPHLADNPINRSIPVLNEFLAIKWDNGNDFFPPTSMQIMNLSAGTGSINIIPSELKVQFNFRFGTSLTDRIIKERVVRLLNHYQLKYTLEWDIPAYPFLTPQGDLIDAVVKSIVHYNNIQPQLLTTGGTSDGRFITLLGAQIVELGPVNATIHKANEFVRVSDLQMLSNIYQNIMERLLS